MRGLVAAIRFLTVFPLPGRWGADERSLAGSVPFFPFVGLLIGAVAGAAAWGLAFALPPAPAAALVALLLALASRGLHLDGMADTMDGLLGGATREKALEIMRDSRIGTMGAGAVFAILLLKTSALASLEGDAFWRGAFLAPVAGRTALVLAMALMPYVRPKGGLGTAFYRNRPRKSAFFALGILAAAGWLAAGSAGLASSAAGMAGALLLALWARAKIGGATGDTLGAGCEAAETFALLFFCGWMRVAGL